MRINSAETSWTRQYFEEYLKFGFIAGGTENNLPVCVICNVQLSNEAMKSSKLKRHLDTHHFEYSDKPIHFFEDNKETRIDCC